MKVKIYNFLGGVIWIWSESFRTFSRKKENLDEILDSIDVFNEISSIYNKFKNIGSIFF